MNINEVNINDINSKKSTYNKQDSTANNSEKKESTKIIFRNTGYVDAAQKMQEKIENKYRGIVAANRSICKTEDELHAYIWDKYYNKYSYRYVKGLSKEERDACFNNEFNLSRGWKACCFLDPVAKKYNIPLSIDRARENQYNRNQINAQIADIFAENQIVVPR
ncbi:MAG: DUF4885 family protein, partial [Lachnospiraceae bacterium]|nr:DUF4885 family protein [Lachnospiraceae bacterium]